MDNNISRCGWTANDNLMNKYHDTEWGVPVYDDTKLFEFLILDAFQAGLSWKTILHKRENFRVAFDNFDVHKIAAYDQEKITQLLNNAGIVRNRLKINAAIINANAFMNICDEFGSFSDYIWQFTANKTIVNKWESLKEIPARTAESDAMSKDLIKRGFKFVASTICYAFMQAAGMVNDHTIHCFRYKNLI